MVFSRALIGWPQRLINHVGKNNEINNDKKPDNSEDNSRDKTVGQVQYHN